MTKAEKRQLSVIVIWQREVLGMSYLLASLSHAGAMHFNGEKPNLKKQKGYYGRKQQLLNLRVKLIYSLRI